MSFRNQNRTKKKTQCITSPYQEEEIVYFFYLFHEFRIDESRPVVEHVPVQQNNQDHRVYFHSGQTVQTVGIRFSRGQFFEVPRKGEADYYVVRFIWKSIISVMRFVRKDEREFYRIILTGQLDVIKIVPLRKQVVNGGQDHRQDKNDYDRSGMEKTRVMFTFLIVTSVILAHGQFFLLTKPEATTNLIYKQFAVAIIFVEY